MKKLLARRVVRSEGAKRGATKYFAVEGGTASSLTADGQPRRNRKAGGKRRAGKKR